MKIRIMLVLTAAAIAVVGPVSAANALPLFRAANGAEKFEVKGHGVSVQEFRFGEGEGSTVSCAKSTFNGHTDYIGPQSFVQFIPGFEGCKDSSSIVKIKITNCEIIFHNDGTIQFRTWPENAKPPCTIVIEVEFAGIGCKVTVAEQEGLKGVTYENLKEKGNLKVRAAVTNLKSEAAGSGCSLAGITVGKHENGIYKGEAEIENLKLE